MKPELPTAVGKKNGSTKDQSAVLERLSHLSLEPNPVLMEHAKQRAMSVQNRIADKITAFAGSIRADAKRQVIANQQWQTVKEEDKQNEELLNLSNESLKLTTAIHSSTKAGPEGAPLPKS